MCTRPAGRVNLSSRSPAPGAGRAATTRVASELSMSTSYPGPAGPDVGSIASSWRENDVAGLYAQQARIPPLPPGRIDVELEPARCGGRRRWQSAFHRNPRLVCEDDSFEQMTSGNKLHRLRL